MRPSAPREPALARAIPRLGGKVGLPSLRVRAGVLTGSAAVDLGDQGTGMVAERRVAEAARATREVDAAFVLEVTA